MRKVRKVTSLPFVCAIAAATLCTGYTVHAGYYDPYYHDRHPVAGEVVFSTSGSAIRIAITGN